MPNFRESRSLQKEKQRRDAVRADAREKRRQASLKRLARAAAVLAALAVVVVAGWAGLGPVRLSAVTDFLQTAGRRGQGYPMETGSGSVLQTGLAGGSLALLWPTVLEVHTPDAYRSLQMSQTYADPALHACGQRLVMFDRASGKLSLLSKTGLLHEKELPRALFCVGLNRRGDIAAACGTEGAASEITAWNTKEKQVFSWRCEKEYPSALQPSKNGSSIGMCLVGTEQAGRYARFVEYGYNDKVPRIDLRIQDASLYGAVQRGSRWLAVGDQAVYRIKAGEAQPEVYSYEGRALLAFSLDESGWCAVLLEDWDNRALLRIYNRAGTLEAKQEFARQPLELTCRGGSVYLRFDDTLLRWRRAAGFRQSDSLPAGVQDAFPAGGAAYALTVRSVERVRLQWRTADESLF